jgi:hypothetical protein
MRKLLFDNYYISNSYYYGSDVSTPPMFLNLSTSISFYYDVFFDDTPFPINVYFYDYFNKTFKFSATEYLPSVSISSENGTLFQNSTKFITNNGSAVFYIKTLGKRNNFYKIDASFNAKGGMYYPLFHSFFIVDGGCPLGTQADVLNNSCINCANNQYSFGDSCFECGGGKECIKKSESQGYFFNKNYWVLPGYDDPLAIIECSKYSLCSPFSCQINCNNKSCSTKCDNTTQDIILNEINLNNNSFGFGFCQKGKNFNNKKIKFQLKSLKNSRL